MRECAYLITILMLTAHTGFGGRGRRETACKRKEATQVSTLLLGTVTGHLYSPGGGGSVAGVLPMALSCKVTTGPMALPWGPGVGSEGPALALHIATSVTRRGYGRVGLRCVVSRSGVEAAPVDGARERGGC